jgi:hypothetical protein
MEAGAAHHAPSGLPRALRAVPFAAAALAFAAYAATAARTITWWDGSTYPLAAVTLGIAPAPGSLLLTILGWIVSQVPIVHPVAFRLNLFAALLAATLVGLITWLGARLATPEEREPGAAEWCAGAIAGLVYGFGVTPWTYATQFTPYGLSSLWTALILVAALAWWRRPARSNGHARLFVLFLLFGLDVSVHRTNSLLFPAALVWVALRTPGSGSRLKDAAAAASGLALGFAFHLLLIPMAARRPGFMIEDTRTLAGFWQYVAIEQKGGGFLFHVFPRTASFFSVQVADYAQFLARNLGALFFLPALLVVLGWLAIARDHPRRALGLLAFFLCAGPGAVIYFNLPHGYLRPIDRHYLPSLVILAPWIAVAVAAALRRVARVRGGQALAAALAAVAALPVGLAWWTHHRACDLSRMRFTETYARDSLEPLPPGAILLTNGDNDSLPLWYMQRAEGVRRDVTVINLPLANTGACVGQLRREDPALAHLLDGVPLSSVLETKMVRDTLVTTVVEPRTALGLPAGAVAPEAVTFSPPDTLYGEDQVVLDLLRLTRWRRPIYLAVTVTPDHVAWLWPYARLDGLAYRVIPSTDRAVWDLDHLRTQLFERVSYADIADTTVTLGADMRPLFRNYLSALLQLAYNQLGTGRVREAQDTLRFLEAHVPPERVGGGREDVDAFRTQLVAAQAKLDAAPGR